MAKFHPSFCFTRTFSYFFFFAGAFFAVAAFFAVPQASPFDLQAMITSFSKGISPTYHSSNYLSICIDTMSLIPNMPDAYNEYAFRKNWS